MNTPKIITITYILLIVSALFPIIYLLAGILYWSLFHSTAIGGGYMLAMYGLPICAYVIPTGMILSFIMSVFIKQKNLVLISLLSVITILFVIYQASASPIHPGEGPVVNVGIGLISLPIWFYVIYFAILFIMSGRWFLSYAK